MTPFDYSDFINRHPLRYLCPESPVDFLLEQAMFLSNRSIEYLSQWYELPVSPEKLEEILKSRNIIIGKQTGSFAIDHYSGHFLAWTDPERNLIHLNEKVMEELAESGSTTPGCLDLSFEIIRGIVLAHEWFHILFDEIRKPYEWDSLKISEQIIIEEISARIFSTRVSGQYPNPFMLDELIHNSATP
jgi:hypothetical protein